MQGKAYKIMHAIEAKALRRKIETEINAEEYKRQMFDVGIFYLSAGFIVLSEQRVWFLTMNEIANDKCRKAWRVGVEPILLQTWKAIAHKAVNWAEERNPIHAAH